MKKLPFVVLPLLLCAGFVAVQASGGFYMGDLNDDGRFDLKDLLLLQSHLLGHSDDEAVSLYRGDINQDGEIDGFDSALSKRTLKNEAEFETETETETEAETEIISLTGESSPLLGTWHSENASLYAAYNAFTGSDGLTVFLYYVDDSDSYGEPCLDIFTAAADSEFTGEKNGDFKELPDGSLAYTPSNEGNTSAVLQIAEDGTLLVTAGENQFTLTRGAGTCSVLEEMAGNWMLTEKEDSDKSAVPDVATVSIEDGCPRIAGIDYIGEGMSSLVLTAGTDSIARIYWDPEYFIAPNMHGDLNAGFEMESFTLHDTELVYWEKQNCIDSRPYAMFFRFSRTERVFRKAAASCYNANDRFLGMTLSGFWALHDLDSDRIPELLFFTSHSSFMEEETDYRISIEYLDGTEIKYGDTSSPFTGEEIGDLLTKTGAHDAYFWYLPETNEILASYHDMATAYLLYRWDSSTGTLALSRAYDSAFDADSNEHFYLNDAEITEEQFRQETDEILQQRQEIPCIHEDLYATLKDISQS